MGKYEKLAEDIIQNVGGIDNVNELTHCITRLRFRLKDESKANDDVLKGMDDVVTVMHSAGQYQVVIGNHVAEVYSDINELTGLQANEEPGTTGEKQSFFNKLIDFIGGSFQPMLPALCAAGIVKGLNALFAYLLGAEYVASGTYLVLNGIGDSVFRFMPIILGYTAAKKIKINPVVGMLIGATLVYPTLQQDTLSATGEALGTIPFIGDYFTTFLGIPLVAGNYTSTVIPVLVIVAFASLVEKFGKKYIPSVLQTFFVPLLVLIVSIPLGLLLIGPLVSVFTNMLSVGIMALYDMSPLIAGAIIGLAWQVLVIFGLHWAIVPIAIMNIGSFGYETIMMCMFTTTFAQTAVLTAMYTKMNNPKQKALAIPAIISAICGVTEPSIYGFTLPAKKPFVYSLLASGIGGALIAGLGTKKYAMGGTGIFGFVNFISPEGNVSGMYNSIIAAVVTMLIGFLLTYFLWKDESEVVNDVPATNEKKSKMSRDIVVAPMSGKVIPLSELKDDAFAQGILGQGMGIIPSDGKVISPVDGTISVLFPTLHAIGITADSGIEILIHVGFDTVQLEGKGFKAFVKQGDKVIVGQHLLDVDLDLIKEAGYSTETPVIITNSSDMLDIIETESKEISENDPLISVVF